MAAAMGTTILTLPAPEGNGTGGGDGDCDGDQQLLQQAPPKPPPPGAKTDPPATVATHTRPIGIIYPPAHIRIIIEKTATFVAKNGLEFERRIIFHNQDNGRFNFLQPSDPYHAYYQQRLCHIITDRL